MNYKFCIVGHGKYPEGIRSALSLLANTTKDISIFNLDKNMTHEDFEHSVTDFLTNHKYVIWFADMTGGAPHQTIARLILEKEKANQYIISGAPLNLILDLYMKCQTGVLNDENIKQGIKKSIKEAKSLINVIPDTNFNKSPNKNDEDFYGGI